MKKLTFFLLTALTCIALVSCSWCESEPIEPQIFGTGAVHYNAHDKLWYVAIDSMQYAVSTITIPDRNPPLFSKKQTIEPLEGMIVTVFTSKHNIGIEAIAGTQSVQQIEDMYYTNNTGLYVMICIMIVFCLLIHVIARSMNESIPTVNADA